MTKKETKNLYEGMYIIDASLSDDACTKALERISNTITEKGGEVHKVHDQGRRRLAYEINKKKVGIYYILYFTVRSSAIKEMWEEYHLNEDLVRFITLRVDEVKEKIEFKSLIEQ